MTARPASCGCIGDGDEVIGPDDDGADGDGDDVDQGVDDLPPPGVRQGIKVVLDASRVRRGLGEGPWAAAIRLSGESPTDSTKRSSQS